MVTLEREALRQRILAMVEARGPDRTVCPSEVARAIGGPGSAWRALMPEIRLVAAALAAAGRLQVTRRGRVVDALEPGGPIRLGLPPAPKTCRS